MQVLACHSDAEDVIDEWSKRMAGEVRRRLSQVSVAAMGTAPALALLIQKRGPESNSDAVHS